MRRIRHWHVRAAAEEAWESADGQVRVVATTMLRLYSRREAADYNHLARFTRERARELIDIADEIVEAVTTPAFAEGDGGQSLLRQLAAQPDAS